VKRGKWVLENILGTPPPKPPAVVPALELSKGVQIHSVREQMELHRKNPTCAACHRIMGGIGFALANFDADGKWRDMAGHPRQYDGKSVPINAKTELWDGREVNGPSELREALLRYTPQFVRFAVEKLMTYGVGRGVDYTDMPQIRSIVNEARADNYSFSSLVLGVVKSPEFLMRVKQSEVSDNGQAQDPTTVAEK
jgi:hypothetical protein